VRGARRGLSLIGVPEQILTDNGKVFTGRLARRPSTVAFDRICLNNGIRHILTAPYSPTTTGKIERLHKTMRKELVTGCRFASVAHAQDELDRWVTHYLEREHQAIGDVPPIRRFELVETAPAEVLDSDVRTEEAPERGTVAVRPQGGPSRAHQHPQAPLPRRTLPGGPDRFGRFRRRTAPRHPQRRPRGHPRAPAPGGR
jgi:hypothetical protein